MIRFILNKKEISTSLSPSMLLLDLIRYHEHLTGTKIGCREGDCGACTILVGEIINDKLVYTSATSCLMAIGNANGKHIVTIEGINLESLNKVQEAFSNEGATQCGFCTPGFVVSLTGFCMSEQSPTYEKAIESINGNICRCTGYKSIERAAQKINILMQDRAGKTPLSFAIENNVIPAYFSEIKERLIKLGAIQTGFVDSHKFLGGGTDLYVQQHETLPYENVQLLNFNKALQIIEKQGEFAVVGGAVTVSAIAASPVFKEHFANLQGYMKLISSTQIRNMATIGGNFINASPIGDLTIFFLALNAKLFLSDGTNRSEILLCDLYKGYKLLDKKDNEFIEQIRFRLPVSGHLFNFEKVSKRTHLDIASVNSAIHLVLKNDIIAEARLSAGGVGPIPMFLKNSSLYLEGKNVTPSVIEELIGIAQSEISPITDARGTKDYKRLLLAQLIKAHFITLFPSVELHAITIPT